MVFILVSLYLIFTISAILLIFKLTKKYEIEKRLIIKMFSLGFTIPFINVVFYIIAGALGQYDSLIFAGIGAIWLFAILPFAFTTVQFLMIKKQAPFKQLILAISNIFLIYAGYGIAIKLLTALKL